MPVHQKTLFAVDEPESIQDRRGSFVDNMKLPVHRWFRYSAGFSAQWAKAVIAEHARPERSNVLDPFVGSGTVVLESAAAGATGIGVEAHPFVRRIAGAKTQWPDDPRSLEERAAELLSAAGRQKESPRDYPKLVSKCYPGETLERLTAIQSAWENQNDGSPESELCWLAMVAILRVTSPVGTAPWQYVLPAKSKAKAIEPFLAYRTQIDIMVSDMIKWRRTSPAGTGRILDDDARDLQLVPDDWADLVITSPPYANNYDYADATRLEQSFLGEISSWGDLQAVTRRHLVRACTQHVAKEVQRTEELLQEPLLAPIHQEISQVCRTLAVERESRGGRKPYHTMLAFYFHDLSRVWQSLWRVTRAGGRVCFVIGDSAPYGVYAPVDRWLGELALSAGFKSWSFEKLRDRNTKWKNRKHTVGLKEGILWVDA